MNRLAILAVLASSGCASSWADMGGSIGGMDFAHPRGVYHGGKYILITDRAIGCQEVGWVDETFIDGDSPRTGLDFVALLLVNDDGYSEETPQINVGFHDVNVWGLINLGDFEAHHGREGTVNIDKVTDDSISGSVTVAFANEGVGGTFQSEFCQSLENR